MKNEQDPSQVRKDKKQQHILQHENSFETVAREWHEVWKVGRTPRHAEYVMRRLEADVFPPLGSIPINKIKAPEILAAIRVIEARGALDIAHRALQTIGQVFRYGIATGRTESNPSSDLRGALKIASKTNFSHLSAAEMPEFLSKLASYDGHIQTLLAIRLLILTFVRTGELRGATWSEIDLGKKEWRIPAERMKMRELHIVPLSKQAIEVLQQLKQLGGNSPYVFHNQANSSKVMSENTMLYALYRLGFHSRATIHGFRATASTILNENNFRSDVIERQLSHGERNKIRASYNHAQYLMERREMMQWYADYLDGIEVNGQVVNINIEVA